MPSGPLDPEGVPVVPPLSVVVESELPLSPPPPPPTQPDRPTVPNTPAAPARFRNARRSMSRDIFQVSSVVNLKVPVVSMYQLTDNWIYCSYI